MMKECKKERYNEMKARKEEEKEEGNRRRK